MAARGKCEEKTALRHKRPAACSQEKPSPKKEAPTFRYEGAKALLAPTIVAYIPKRGRKFIDLLAGRGNVTFRAMAEDLEYEEWILNDLNTAPFFRALRDHGDQVTVPQKSKQEFLRLAELAKQGDPEALLMEPWLAFNGGSYDSGGSTSSGGRRTPESYQRNLRATHKLIHQKNPRITSLDWRDCLEAEQPGPDDFVFVDGPYIGCNVGAYSPESISPCELVEFLKSATFNWILTEYRQPIYLEAFGAPIFEKAVRLRTPYCANTGGQERRIECIWTNVGKDPAKRDSVTVQVKPVPPDRKDTYYCDLQLDELLDEIKQCAIAITAARNQMSAEMRKRLLPALLELKKRTYRKRPGFYDTLRAVNLNPDTVRQWFYRGRTADEIIEVMEEEPTKPVVVRRGPRRESSDVRDLYIEHLEKVVKAVLANKITLAKRLATEYLRVREENRV